MTEYRIEARREDRSVARGTLRFLVDGAERFSTTFWEDPGKLIPAKTYTGCSTTTMVSKGHEAVFLPDGQTGRVGIFIHPGSEPAHSEGCLVAATDRVREIYRTVPRDARNVTVVVSEA
ncbi:MAG: hypothetical protein EVA89_21980 [Sandaracinaceae bacterium]|nr:MAG: hypothetical protein EVA89_21980 [Sandaracinaceae bacterium]